SAYLAAGKAKNLIIYISFNLVFLFLQWVDVGGNFKVWLLPNMNPNVMGFFVCLNLLLLIYFVGSRCGLILKSISLLLIPLAFFLIFVSTARSIWLALAICLIIYTVMQSLISNRSIFNVLAFLVTFLLLFFPHIYIYLSESTLGIQIDTFVSDVTNKRFFTGREVIWQEMYKGLGDSVFFGMGMGATNSDIGLRSSSHNLYMSFFFQFGVVGVAFFLLSFFLVIKNAVRNLDAYMGYKNRDICFKCTSLMGALLISLLVQQSFELFLFQNNLPASFLFWCGLVLYYSQTYKSYRK
ncbi:hypothetical protein BZJ19_16680, partial [Salinivibrio proteolyticus]|uniref:O-antigen ligase family protein n=1 Tax=Salinivibrio proteolyticus TaxID=334715 RepID=UPI0009C9F549